MSYKLWHDITVIQKNSTLIFDGKKKCNFGLNIAARLEHTSKTLINWVENDKHH